MPAIPLLARFVAPTCRSTALIIGLLAAPAFTAHAQAPIQSDQPVFRAPFTLKLPVDTTHYYEQQFDKVPYVTGGDIYLFNGESFGVNLTIDGDHVSGLTYVANAAKADVQFSFRQEKSGTGLMTLLTTRNKTKHKLFIDALMTVPDKKGGLKTNILPIDAGLSSFESWPHPIVQLVLKNLRFTADIPASSSH